MTRRASSSKVNYKELGSDSDGGSAPWGLSDDDDDDDFDVLEAAVGPLTKNMKDAGTKCVGDTYGARESSGPCAEHRCESRLTGPSTSTDHAGRPQRKKAKKNPAPLPVEPKEDRKSHTSQEESDDGKPLEDAVAIDSNSSALEDETSSDESGLAPNESKAAGDLKATGFSGKLLLKLPFEMFAEASAPTRYAASSLC